ncbi:MAG: hypothetical protein AAF840_00590 [Bacteroidota bacterium]
MRYLIFLFLAFGFFSCSPQPPVEVNGYIMVEAEDYRIQNLDVIRRWVRIDGRTTTEGADPDPDHHRTASGGAYLEALPDTRVTHDDELIPGTNFSNEPGKMAVLNYPIEFTTPGRYYVWVRAYSTGSEDNGIHVGLNGEWPASGQRLQWCEGKNAWTWESKQRTQEVHCGEPKLIYLDIPEKGIHTISFSLREDGFEFDAFVLEQAYEQPGERP